MWSVDHQSDVGVIDAEGAKRSQRAILRVILWLFISALVCNQYSSGGGGCGGGWWWMWRWMLEVLRAVAVQMG
jgi:hypothetical protein